MQAGWYDKVEAALGKRPLGHGPLSGGCIAEVHRLEMPGGEPLVAKVAAQAEEGAAAGDGLELEGWMLDFLAENSTLPVPKVLFSDGGLLLMTCLPGGGSLNPKAEEHAAELLAALHAVSGPDEGARRFGLERDTVIGGLRQPNPWASSWVDFFREQRLMFMARECLEAGRLDKATMSRLEALAVKLDDLIDEPEHPSLVHGDMWGGNVVVEGPRVSGFVDPAICFADAEIELAFSTLFNTFGDAFFSRYGEIRPIRPGFFEVRRDIYNLWHLLTHVHLFGGGYLSGVEGVLRRHGV